MSTTGTVGHDSEVIFPPTRAVEHGSKGISATNGAVWRAAMDVLPTICPWGHTLENVFSAIDAKKCIE